MTAKYCKECLGIGIEPCRMMLPEGPICSCGKPSRLQSGMCSYDCEGRPCLACKGSGEAPCERCGGSGQVEFSDEAPMVGCPACK